MYSCRNQTLRLQKGIRGSLAFDLMAVMTKWYSSVVVQSWREVARGSRRSKELRALSSIGHKFIGDPLGVAGTENGCGHSWSSQVQDDVFGKTGRRDGLRRGETSGDCSVIGEDGEGEDVHRWCFAALPEEMRDLKGMASVESCGTEFRYSRCIKQGRVEAATLWMTFD